METRRGPGPLDHMRALAHVSLALSLPLLALVGPAQEDEPPKKKEVRELVQEYLELGSRATGDARARQLEIAGRLAVLPALESDDEEDWREDLLEAWDDLPGLPEKKGDCFYWKKERRGRYIVGGRTRKPKGLLIGMHGGGVGSGDAGSIASWYDGPASSLKWVAIFPEVLEKTEHGWTTSGTEEWILDLVEQARRTFGVDADHVYLAGHSMGGFGSWTLGAHHADRVAALAPSAGGPTPIWKPGTQEIVDIDWGVIPSLRNVPMVVYQSIDDPQVPPDVNQHAVQRVEEARERWGGYEHFTYWEVNGQGHGAPPGGPKAHLEKIAEFTRQPVQDRLVWQPVLDWKRQFHWLFWEEPSIAAIVEGTIDREQNAVHVTVALHSARQPASGLAVLLDERLVDMEREVIVTLDGDEVFRGLPERRLEVLLDTSTSGDPGRQYSARVELR